MKVQGINLEGTQKLSSRSFWKQNLENFRTGSEENSDVNVHSFPLFEFFYVILVVLTTKFILKN